MSDQNKATAINDEKNTEPSAKEKKPLLNDFEEQLRKLTAGEIQLRTPITSGMTEHAQLAYNFGAITGWDYANAMDCDPGNTNLFRIGPKQALSLFAEAAQKGTPALSALDVKEKMGAVDAMNAIRIATAFFVASTRVGNKLILNAQ